MGATILTITPPEGLGETVSVNFACGETGIEVISQAIAVVAENPKEVFTLRHLDELDGWKTLTDAGRDIVYVLLTYFPEWLKRYVLRKAYLRCSQLEAREWLMDDSACDPGWKEEE